MVVEGEREKEEESRATYGPSTALSNLEASELAVFSREAASLPLKSLALEARRHTAGRPRKFNFSRLIDSYFFRSICFLGMRQGVTISAE